jgi:hypothetical protein
MKPWVVMRSDNPQLRLLGPSGANRPEWVYFHPVTNKIVESPREVVEEMATAVVECKRCGVQFKPNENTEKKCEYQGTRLVLYHSGKWDKSIFKADKWTCCNALLETDPGCRTRDEPATLFDVHVAPTELDHARSEVFAVTISAGSRSTEYEINLADMTQTNKKTGRVRKIRRVVRTDMSIEEVVGFDTAPLETPEWAYELGERRSGKWEEFDDATSEVLEQNYQVWYRTTGAGAAVSFPRYWNGATGLCRIDVTTEMQGCVEWLMNATAEPQTHGFGRDSHKMHFQKFVVTKVERVENAVCWRQYTTCRSDIRVHPENAVEKVRTDQLRLPHTMNAELDHDAKSEHWLFHGTKPEFVDVIIEQGMDNRVGRGLLGEGTYFAESASKSDQYTGKTQKLYMFLAR